MTDEVPPLAPYCLSLIICDAIWKEPTTGKRSMLGCFSSVAARHFPFKIPSLAVSLALTDHLGKTPVVVKGVKVGADDIDHENSEICKIEGEVDFQDRRAVFELDLIIKNLLFPEPGEYRFQVFAAGVFLMERRLLVLKAEGDE